MFGDPKEQAILAVLCAAAALFGEHVLPFLLHGGL